MNAAERLQTIRSRIPAGVTLIAVSKTHPLEAIEELYALGQRDFGENYAQEMIEKAAGLRARGYSEIRWHFIGHLQTNKVKLILPHVHAVHSVDSERLAAELSKRHMASQAATKLSIFLEVNIDGEGSKTGVTPSDAPAIAARISAMPGLQLEGLMCIPTKEGSDHAVPFKALRELERRCRPHTNGKLSMGMTSDFEAAIREGSTHVRVGTALFGPRR